MLNDGTCQSNLGDCDGIRRTKLNRMLSTNQMKKRLQRGDITVGALHEPQPQGYSQAYKWKPLRGQAARAARGAPGAAVSNSSRAKLVAKREAIVPRGSTFAMKRAAATLVSPAVSTVDRDGLAPVVFPPFGPK